MQNTANIAYISLGSNTGDSEAWLDEALRRLAALPGLEVAAVSGRYRTEPQNDKNQPWFVNQVAALYTGLAPLDLLKALQGIETALGRVREQGRRFGPRSLDLDIIIYVEKGGEGGGLEVSLPELTLPHPRFRQRAFVLVPLREIAAQTSEKLLAETRAALDKLEYRLEGDRIYQA